MAEGQPSLQRRGPKPQRPKLEDFDPREWTGDPDELPLEIWYDEELCERTFTGAYEAFGAGAALAAEYLERYGVFGAGTPR